MGTSRTTHSRITDAPDASGRAPIRDLTRGLPRQGVAHQHAAAATRAAANSTQTHHKHGLPRRHQRTPALYNTPGRRPAPAETGKSAACDRRREPPRPADARQIKYSLLLHKTQRRRAATAADPACERTLPHCPNAQHRPSLRPRNRADHHSTQSHPRSHTHVMKHTPPPATTHHASVHLHRTALPR